ncbi:MAG: hypothetical protein PHP44_01570 [Kiritimatiellae bacterium]|nr:hypothetical protein [Kiritimatiellia bacterium]
MEITGMQEMDPAEIIAMRQAMFTKMDSNGDGVLDAGELQQMADVVGISTEQILTDGDSNEDGLMDQSEMDALGPKGPPPPKPGMGGRLFENETESDIQELLDAIAEASDEEDAETSIKKLIAEFMEKASGMRSSTSQQDTGLLVDTYG